MRILKRLYVKFWRTLAKCKHRYTLRYAKALGVNVAEDVKFTGVPDFSTEPWLVEIGPKCLITQDVRFMTHDGSVSIVRRLGGRYKDIMKFGKIIVEDNVFIGANAVIMPSVRIGSHAVIAAGSYVTKDVPAAEVWGGIPAKKICTLQEYADKLYSISLDYASNEALPKMNKKDCSTVVAETYWHYNH